MPKRAAWSRSMTSDSFGAVVLLIGGDIAQLRQLLQRRQQPRRPGIELVEIGVLQRVLILRARRAAAHVDVLRGLQEQRAAAAPVRILRAQPLDDLVGGRLALVARLEAQHHEAVVERAAAADERAPSSHIAGPWRRCRSAAAADCTICMKEISCGASDRPGMMPVSCCGKKPLGTSTYSSPAMHQRDDEGHQRRALMAPAPSRVRACSADQPSKPRSSVM